MPTGKQPASDAGKLLGDKSTPPKVKEVAASTLSQAKPTPETTGPKPASDAGKLLGTPATPAPVKRVAASDLAQAKPKPPAPPAKGGKK